MIDPRAPMDEGRERALLRELSATCRHLNQTYFKGALPPVQLSLSDADGFLGRYLHATKSIELSRSFVQRESWGSIVEVLKHELAHQFVLSVLRETEAAHGPAFRAVCARLGIDARARGVPEAPPSAASQRVLERVHKLLALAQSDNRNEAEAAAAAAQRLMLRHNLDAPSGPSDEEPYTYRHLGRITGRVSEWERRLGNILGEHFFVEIIWVPAYRPDVQKRGSVMEAVGTPENLALAEYVYAFLVNTGERLWKSHKEAQGIAQDRDRMAYLAGVMSGFAQKLEDQARVNKAEGLVWIPHAGLSAYTRKRHPYLRTVQHAGRQKSTAFEHGQQAGRNVLLHRGITHGASGETKLLRS